MPWKIQLAADSLENQSELKHSLISFASRQIENIELVQESLHRLSAVRMHHN